MAARDNALRDLTVCAYMAEFMVSPGDITQQALEQIWRNAMKPVPTDQLLPMYYAAMQYETKRAPRPNDVLAAWSRHQISKPRMTFQEEEAQQASQGHALTGTDDGAGRKAFQLSKAIATQRGGVPICFCTYPSNVPVAANVSEDGQWWVCPNGICDFRWPIDDVTNVPIGLQSGPIGETSRSPTLVEDEENPLPQTEEIA